MYITIYVTGDHLIQPILCLPLVNRSRLLFEEGPRMTLSYLFRLNEYEHRSTFNVRIYVSGGLHCASRKGVDLEKQNAINVGTGVLAQV